MNNRLVLCTALMLVALAPGIHAQMNVLVVVTDDQRFETVDKMPNLAGLVAQGVRFDNAYMSTPNSTYATQASFFVTQQIELTMTF